MGMVLRDHAADTDGAFLLLLQHAKFGGNRYGTSKRTIEEQTAKGRVVVLDIEMEVSMLASPFPYHLPDSRRNKKGV